MTTQHANATYQEIIDLHTEKDTVSVIGIHTPSTRMPIAMLSGFWQQFNKFRYNGCSFSMVPAARLPIDPLNVGYGAGEPGIDPRDNLNPILFHGCHGNDMGKILNQFYQTGPLSLLDFNADNQTFNKANMNQGWKGKVRSTSTQSADITTTSSTSLEFNEQYTNRTGDIQLESLYYRALTDTTWKKSGPQSGLKIKGLHPLVYSVATTRALGNSGVQIAQATVGTDIGNPDGATRGVLNGAVASSSPSNSAGTGGLLTEGEPTFLNAQWVQGPQETNSGGTSVRYYGYSDTPLFTPRTQPLGWMDTRLRDENGQTSVTGLNGTFVHDVPLLSERYTKQYENFATVPKIYMGMLLLPRAYKTEQYFRCVITHSFSFKGFRGQSMTTDNRGDVSVAPGYWNFNVG